MQTRSRAVQSRLEARKEEFVAECLQANSSSNPQAAFSGKRKHQDVGGLEKPASAVQNGARNNEAGKVSTVVARKKAHQSDSRGDPAKAEPSFPVMKSVPRTEPERLASTPEPSKKSSKLMSPEEPEEKRLKRYRKQAPQSFLQKLHRSQTQRLIVLKRTRSDTEASPKEDIELVGSTGNIYTVSAGEPSFGYESTFLFVGRHRTDHEQCTAIAQHSNLWLITEYTNVPGLNRTFECSGRQLQGFRTKRKGSNADIAAAGRFASCTCPDHMKGNECKHKVYVLNHVLKAPEHLQYQLAFLSSELRDIFAAAPPIPSDVSSAEDTDGKRKPVEGECPICYMDFDEDNNALVWCKAACGNNMHKRCFDQWAASQRGVEVKCVYCRTAWHSEHGDAEQVKQAGSIGVDGYVNVGERFGMSQARDYSTYHPFWVRRQLGAS